MLLPVPALLSRRRPPQVPPNLGNSTANAGVSLARLLWFLTPRQAVTLVASLLLERRILLVARDADTVSAAVHAANALLYPVGSTPCCMCPIHTQPSA